MKVGGVDLAPMYPPILTFPLKGGRESVRKQQINHVSLLQSLKKGVFALFY